MSVTNERSNSLYTALAKAILLAACIFVLLWLLSKMISAILLLLFAIVMAVIINAPVTRLEKRGMKRGWACLIVFGLIALSLVLLGWLVVPKISEQLQSLIYDLPTYADQLSKQAASWFQSVPAISNEIKRGGNDLSTWLPSVPQTLTRIGNFSLSLLAGILIFIIFVSMVVYAVINPRPLFEIYFLWFPASKRETAAKAFQDASVMLAGWFRSNLIGGTIEGICSVIILTILGVPGAWVWGAMALLAQLIPRLGFYIMSVPPILVALSVSPTTALWVTIFFLAMDEIMGDFVMPRLRSSAMSIHPVSIMFLVLAMGSAFGFIGALLATPLAAIIKAYYYTFYVKEDEQSKTLQKQIDEVMRTEVRKFDTNKTKD